MEDLFRTVSTAITDRFYSFFSLSAAVLPEEENKEGVEEGGGEEEEKPESTECDVSQDSESDGDIDDELKARLEALYGVATTTAKLQAREVLHVQYGGDVSLFLTQFLSPAVTLLDRLRQEVCPPTDNPPPATTDGDSSEIDKVITLFPADSTWPLTQENAVLVHLCGTSPDAHLADDGDFYFCLQTTPPDGSSGTRPPSLVVRLQSQGEVKEFPVPECEYRRVFSSTAMDWVEKARVAPDSELSYILRQCLIATEYTVRHLQWEEVLERNGLHVGSPPGSGLALSPPGRSPQRSDLNTHNHPAVSDGSWTSRRDSDVISESGVCDTSFEQASLDSSASSRRGNSRHVPSASQESPSAQYQPSESSSSRHGSRKNSISENLGERNGVDGDDVRICAGGGSDVDSRLRSTSACSGFGVGVDTGRGGRFTNGNTSGPDCSSTRGSPPSQSRAEPPPMTRKNSTYYTRRQLEAPNTITDIDYRLLHSGIAVLPGCNDLSGKRIIFIFTCSVLWHNRQVVSAELTRLLMYYFNVPRRELMTQGVTIVVDTRGATSSTVNILLESLYLFKDNLPNSVSVIHMLVDKPTQSMVLKSPVYDPQSGIGLDLLLSQEMLLKSVSIEQLPPALDGSFPYSHEEWVRFRMKVEPFLTNCVTVAQFLVEIMQEISSSDYLPRSTHATRELVDRHEAQVKAAFNDPRLLSVQNDGEQIMSSLRRDDSTNCHSEDYRHALEKVSSLYRQLQDTMTRLATLAETRLNRLEQCLQLRGFEEECDKIVSWLKQEGQSLLDRHSGTADNLKAVRCQQKDFDKLYFSAMTHIEKGNDLIEEASMLAQSGAFSESALGYKDGARLLKKQLQLFAAQLEDTRERIEGTARCYTLLDKSYEWALEAMKYVASMKMEHCASASGLDKLLRSLEQYLHEHPPLCDDSFSHMIDTAQRLHNDKLLEQCRVAKARCQETYHLLLLRQNTLQRARDQLVVEQGQNDVAESLETSSASHDGVLQTRKNNSFTSIGGPVLKSTPQSQYKDTKSAVADDDDFPVWEPRTSTPGREEESWVDTYGLRRSRASSRASSGSEGGSVYSMSLDKSAVVIANPMIDKLMASPTSPTSFLPDRSSSSLADSEFKTPLSKGSARLQLSRTISNPSTPITSASPVAVSLSSSALSSGRHHKKMLKRASTAPVPMIASPIIYEDQEVTDSQGRQLGDRRSGKTLSMMTGSSESLPSMPEEDEEYQENHPDSQTGVSDTSGEGGVSQQWTPVSVNSHLHYNSRTTPTGPMADLRLSEAEIKSRRTILLIMSEMVQTERDYVRSLQYVIENYIPEMQRVDVPQLMRGKRNVIFGNVEKIYQFHSQYFLRELETCLHNPFLVGHYFLRHESQFHLYTLYNKNKPKSDDLMLELGKGFFRQKQLQLGDRMDLSSYLLKPVQRMGKYALLLKQILKECPETDPEYADLKAAEEMVRFQLRHGNDLLAMDSLRECDVNLQEQGKLLRQDEFLVFQGRKKMIRRVFLFEDLILFSKTRRGRQGQHDIYVYKHSLKMADIGMTESVGDSGYKFEIWFRRRSLGDNYILQAPNSEVKRAWVKEIARILWHQAIRNRESHINEMASMGIGTKPCMDIKPSRDNIQDRSLNVNLPYKGARTRNSIAVSSFEYLRGGTKRPHSIISVSSNSSSNSSHSSAGLFGSLNLAFDPLDAPRFQRQSLLSNESGIETDHSTCEGDPGGGKPQPGQTTPISPDQSYSESLRSRGFSQSLSEPVMTDV